MIWAHWIANDQSFLHANREDWLNKTDWMSSLIKVLPGDRYYTDNSFRASSILCTVKSVLSHQSKNWQNDWLKDRWWLIAGQKYCRRLQENILQYFQPAIRYYYWSWKPFLFLSSFKWLLKTGFTVWICRCVFLLSKLHPVLNTDIQVYLIIRHLTITQISI